MTTQPERCPVPDFRKLLLEACDLAENAGLKSEHATRIDEIRSLAPTPPEVEPTPEEVEDLVERLWDASEVVFQAGTSRQPIPWSSAGQITKRTWRAAAREAWRLGARTRKP